MKRYIALLRGINVGGYRKIKMADLRSLLQSMGFEEVKTYIQSGNVVFKAPAQRSKTLSACIEEQIEETFGHDVPVLIREPDKLKSLLMAFPFESREGWKGYISFLSERPGSEAMAKLEAGSSDIEHFKAAGNNLYVFIDKDTDRKPAFSNGFVEKQLGLIATTRNLNTLRKILQLC